MTLGVFQLFRLQSLGNVKLVFLTNILFNTIDKLNAIKQ